MTKPTQLNDPLFGTLTYDEEAGWFKCQSEWNESKVCLNIFAYDINTANQALRTAKVLWTSMPEWTHKVNTFAVSKLLGLKNDNWLDDDEDKVTAVDFIEAMQLASITVYPDGKFEFWHDDGDLFWGHSIQISGSLSVGLLNADIPG